MASGFATCGGCGRHVRSSESACPFCRSVVAPDATVRAILDLPGVRASRAAIFAGAVLVAGCGSDSTPTTGGGGSEGTTDGGVAQPVYGAPVTGIDGGADSGGTGIAQPAYGAPISRDGGLTGGTGGALYGAPVEPLDGG